jgi:penicillin-insensitive murein endopeptidase
MVRLALTALTGLAGLAAAGVLPGPAAAELNGWARITAPAPGTARVHGFYSNGCIAGARRLPRDGRGFAVLRTQRNRFWGHPSLIAFVRDLARRVTRPGEVLLIADISQPRGGPIAGHASHQAGLDADIRLLLLPVGTVTPIYRADPPNVSMLTVDRKAIDRSRWTARQIGIIRAAARDARVDRLFVHPVIKRALCRIATGERRWLAKVVPWYGHHAHMHVRLRCPIGSPGCVRQRALPRGTGCGAALAWWFTDAPYKPRKPSKRPRRKPPLPRACQTVLAR